MMRPDANRAAERKVSSLIPSIKGNLMKRRCADEQIIRIPWEAHNP
jgi:hypothetical protein